MTARMTFKMASVALFIAVVFGSIIHWSQEATQTTQVELCRAYFNLITEVPVVPGAVVTESKNHSSDANYAKRSASLIQGTIGGKIAFDQFHHLTFEITTSDRKVEANLFRFSF
ncbi:MAG: hypothetical protein SGI71_00810 [Verrucomicrobiota bacterium]|nr:hypothetical protein [Verrucomicrobiota bacterium]